ncbi:hypothetical protein A3D78_01275 [Candidatus Gottesmanbacteria bacterium RIFCSPHIGHO2_02_FULL_39_14]|uniref:Uncharacterized protein n=1 Tax=Candidatus Gottesmanbacteria bacterium RIFCSPHIGHO2_02_FULL_39_14 TaxID=1798383 RepID=A0A1F6A3I9_9BACT|nr:MAG: hypothetical protein A3D78_01275 [Candidatus Gottesmanbacteria bacterium RIFCSPHIGHO2_02_FULL_39_14]
MIPDYAQVIIEANSQYISIRKIFQRFEAEEDISDLTPPWDKVNQQIQKNKLQVKKVLSKVTVAKDPEGLGQALYQAKDRKDKSPPRGKVKAFQHGSLIVLVVDNEDDLRKACNIYEDENVENLGVLDTRVTYRFGLNWNDAYPEIPTIVVLDSGGKTAEERIAHEINHYHFNLYKRYFDPRNYKIEGYFRGQAENAVEEFNKGKISEEQLEAALTIYSRQMIREALSEAAVEMIAREKMDWRESYADDYYEGVSHEAMNSATMIYVNKEKIKFIEDFNKLQKKLGRIVYAFGSLEEDKEVIFGTIGMRLLAVDAENIEHAIEDMDFIVQLEAANEFYYPRQDIFELIEILRKSNMSKVARKQSYSKAERLRDRLIEIAEETKALRNFGYKNARESGMDFSSALTIAVFNRERLLNEVESINIEIKEITDEVDKQKPLAQARKTIDQEGTEKQE